MDEQQLVEIPLDIGMSQKEATTSHDDELPLDPPMKPQEGEPRHVGMKRKRRAAGTNWSLDEEEDWRAKFPDSDIEPWMHSNPQYLFQTFDADLIPDVHDETRKGKSPKSGLEHITVIDAYNKWCAKMSPTVGKRRKNIKLSCPIPGHLDENPSAWADIDKGAWFCGACWLGGDKYDIAAYHFGLPVPDYRRNGQFRELCKSMKADLGIADESTNKSTESDGNARDNRVRIPKPAGINVLPVPGDEAFSGLIGDIVNTFDPYTEASRVAVLIQFLVAFGNNIGHESHVLVGETKHFLNEFAVLVGRSSRSRKGTSWSMVKSLFSLVDPEWTKNKIVSGIVSGEGLISAVRDQKIERRLKPKGRPNEYEDVITDFGVEDKRLMAYESEFASVLSATARSENTTSPKLRQLWDDGDVRVLGKISPVRATGAHVSLAGHITSPELRRLLRATDLTNGFANRILWFVIEKSKSIPRPKPIPKAELKRLSALTAKAVEHAKSITVIDFDDSAEKLWCDVYETIDKSDSDVVGPIIDRAHPHVLRLSAIYALLDCKDVIQEQHLRAALALWECARKSAHEIFGSTLGNKAAEKINYALFTASPNSLSRDDIQRNVFSSHGKAKEIAEALELLERLGRAKKHFQKTAGKQKEYWTHIQETTTTSH